MHSNWVAGSQAELVRKVLVHGLAVTAAMQSIRSLTVARHSGLLGHWDRHWPRLVANITGGPLEHEPWFP